MDTKESRLSVTFVSDEDVVEHILEDGAGGMAESENESCIHELSENSRNFKITHLKMEPPDPLEHDQLPYNYNCVALDIKQDNVDMKTGGPEVDSCLDTTPEGSLDVEVDPLQKVAMKSAELSGDQQRNLVKMEIKFESEDGIINEGGSEHWNDEGSTLLNSSPSLASREIKSTFPKLKTPKIVLQKLSIGKKRIRCEDCHKVLQGSLDDTEQNIVMKCDKCKTNQSLAAELQNQDMDTGSDIPREKINHPALHGTSRICPNVKAKNSDDHSELLRIKDATVLLDHQAKMNGKGGNKRKRMDMQNDPAQEEIKEKKKKEAVNAKEEEKMAQVLTGTGSHAISEEVHRTEGGEVTGQYTKASRQDKDIEAGSGDDGIGGNGDSVRHDSVFVGPDDYYDDGCGGGTGDGDSVDVYVDIEGTGADDDDDSDDFYVDIEGASDDGDVDDDHDDKCAGAPDHDGDVHVGGGNDGGNDGNDDDDGKERRKKKKEITTENLYHLLRTIDRKVDNLFNMVSLFIQKTQNEKQTSQTPKQKIIGHQQPDDETLQLLKARSFSKGNFAKRLITSLVSQEVLKVSNCSGLRTKQSKRGDVKKIPSEILTYVSQTTFRLYNISEEDQSKCFREIRHAIDIYCRHLGRSHRQNQKAMVGHKT